MTVQKPATIKAKTPLERELARLKGYGDAVPLEDVVNDFSRRIEQQDADLRNKIEMQGNGRGALTQRSSSVEPLSSRGPYTSDIYKRAG